MWVVGGWFPVCLKQSCMVAHAFVAAVASRESPVAFRWRVSSHRLRLAFNDPPALATAELAASAVAIRPRRSDSDELPHAALSASGCPEDHVL